MCTISEGPYVAVSTPYHSRRSASCPRDCTRRLYTEEPEEDDKTPHDWENYMDRLLTLLLAYAMAGVTPRANVKDAYWRSPLEPTQQHLWRCPWTWSCTYYHRAKRQSSILPLSQRIAWLEARDLEDRSDWVARFRESSKSLGRLSRKHARRVMPIGCRRLSLEEPGQKRVRQLQRPHPRPRCPLSSLWGRQ